jgi:D-threonate/D-erythronate kinase
MSSSSSQFAIIADDLTGSLDTGLQFRKKGLRTIVPLRRKSSWPEAQVLVINTDSRNIAGETAYQKVFRACRHLKVPALYKKIDSTMRGNVGREAMAIMDAQKIPKAVIVPTIPVLGRTVERGILRVHGVPLLRTSYAQDPFHPISTSRIPDLLQKETGIPVGHISLREVRKGSASLAQKIEKSKERLLAVDAVLQSDLKVIAGAWRILSGGFLPCGSVGLADEIIPSLKPERRAKRKKNRRPLLIIAASRNPRTADQIREALLHFPFPLVEPDLQPLTQSRIAPGEIRVLSDRLLQLLSKERGVVLATTFLTHLPGKEKIIPRALGKIVIRLLAKVRLGGLVLTGGDLAMGVCQELSASALSIEEEVLPGIPCSTLTDGPFKGLHLVTKAGGFGEKEALWRIIQYLRGDYGNQRK